MSFEEFYSLSDDLLEELNFKYKEYSKNADECKIKFLRSHNISSLTDYMRSLELLYHCEGELHGVHALRDRMMNSLT